MPIDWYLKYFNCTELFQNVDQYQIKDNEFLTNQNSKWITALSTEKKENKEALMFEKIYFQDAKWWLSNVTKIWISKEQWTDPCM